MLPRGLVVALGKQDLPKQRLSPRIVERGSQNLFGQGARVRQFVLLKAKLGIVEPSFWIVGNDSQSLIEQAGRSIELSQAEADPSCAAERTREESPVLDQGVFRVAAQLEGPRSVVMLLQNFLLSGLLLLGSAGSGLPRT